MTNMIAPFRADMVGSLLRPQKLKEARAAFAAGKIDHANLRALEDVEITTLIKRQENIGLKAVTDGELRRAYWHLDFLEQIEGVTPIEADSGMNFKGNLTISKAMRVTGKLTHTKRHPMVADFEFVKAHTAATAKMTIPSPSMLHYRGGRKMINAGLYPDMAEFYADLGAVYAKFVTDFTDAGCRYLQLDDVSFAYLCDPEQRKMLAERGDDPAHQPEIYAAMINQAVANRPKDMTITMHLCRGNFRSTFIASGGYEPIAELLFNTINIDGYFMEWDNERSGGFEPLRFLPKGKRVVLGLVTSKTGTIEKKDDLKRRIDEAAKFVPLEQLCLSPQCGFASTEEGNILAEDEQWKKLELIVTVAREVWGDFA